MSSQTDLHLGAVNRDDRSAPFFDASAEGRLLIHRCETCGHRYGPELQTCTACGSADAAWEQAAGDATIVSWVVVHRRDGDGNPVTTPVATAELPEGPWLTLPLIASDSAAIRDGAAVHVDFVRPEGSEAIPVWRL